MHQSQHPDLSKMVTLCVLQPRLFAFCFCLYMYDMLCAARYAFRYAISNVSVERRTLAAVCISTIILRFSHRGCIDEWLFSRCHSPRTATRTMMPRGARYRHVYPGTILQYINVPWATGVREVRGSCRTHHYRRRSSSFT